MYYKYMDLFYLCHSCLEAYRSGWKYFILCVTLSSKEDAIFSVIHFSCFIDNCTCFDVKKTVAVLYQLPWNPKLTTLFDPQCFLTNILWKQNAQRARIFYILFHICVIMNLFMSPAKVLPKYSNLTI